MQEIDYRTLPDLLSHEQMAPMYQADFFVDGAILETEDTMVFRKVVRMSDPHIAGQKTCGKAFPHHLAGECYISLSAQAAGVLLMHKGLLTTDWRGHGTRIRQAVFRGMVLVGETVYVEAKLLKKRVMWQQFFCTFSYKIWKYAEAGEKKLCYESEQEAVFFEAREEEGEGI